MYKEKQKELFNKSRIKVGRRDFEDFRKYRITHKPALDVGFLFNLSPILFPLLKFAQVSWRNYLILLGGPSGNRTQNLLIKSQVLCLIELTARICFSTIDPGRNV